MELQRPSTARRTVEIESTFQVPTTLIITSDSLDAQFSDMFTTTLFIRDDSLDA